MKKILLILMVLLIGATIARAEVVSQEISYVDGETTLKGFLVYDDAL